MGCFEWISPRPLPARFDLRAHGWRLADGDSPVSGPWAGLVDIAAGAIPDSFAPALRRRALALALPCSRERARWLAAGFADALPPDAGLAEIDQRARRIVGQRGPAAATRRELGRLTLDLVERDARCAGRRLRLHPREFALLWRLAEAGGEPVPRAVLLHDVWQLRHEPETNSLAVHICRLRRKLAAAGLASLVVTGPGDAGYRLFVEPTETLDAAARLREPSAAASGEERP